MSKEHLEVPEKEYLKALDRLVLKNEYKTFDEFDNDYVIVRQALLHLESIDNANPSEALEELDYIGKNCYEEAGNAEEDCILYAKDYIGFNTIKQALIKSQEQEKVLKIIKKKVFPLNHHTMIINHYKEYRSYHSAFNQFYEDVYDAEKYLLSKEDFELLKRYFNEEKD